MSSKVNKVRLPWVVYSLLATCCLSLDFARDGSRDGELVEPLLLTSCSAQAQEDQIRQPAVSGTFYPSEPAKLKTMVEDFLNKANPPPQEGELKGLVVPHAGYVYSGQVAAFAFKLLEKKRFDTVIILGPSHRVYFDGAVVYNIGDFLTPLGVASVDKKLAGKIVSANAKIKIDTAAHRYEHSIEVQLPFLQTVLSEFNFVPILMSNMNLANCQMLAKTISAIIKDKKTLVIASSDMSHYHDYQTAKAIDAVTLKLIEENKVEELNRALDEGKSELCGGGSVVTLMLIMKELGADKIKVLSYANSGDTTFDFNRVVGYCAVSFSSSHPSGQAVGEKQGSSALTPEDKKMLLGMARQTLEIFLKERKIPEFKAEGPLLLEKRGAFVTLKKKDGLRGCVGNFAEEPLYIQIPQVAVSSAINDFRFMQVSSDELKDIKIEISILSPMKEVNSLNDIMLGKHGIYVKAGHRTGCFLPQVAQETGWTKEEFLRHCFTDKAGLPPDAWEKGAQVFVFTAEVFSEED